MKQVLTVVWLQASSPLGRVLGSCTQLVPVWVWSGPKDRQICQGSSCSTRRNDPWMASESGSLSGTPHRLPWFGCMDGPSTASCVSFLMHVVPCTAWVYHHLMKNLPFFGVFIECILDRVCWIQMMQTKCREKLSAVKKVKNNQLQRPKTQAICRSNRLNSGSSDIRFWIALSALSAFVLCALQKRFWLEMSGIFFPATKR